MRMKRAMLKMEVDETEGGGEKERRKKQEVRLKEIERMKGE